MGLLPLACGGSTSSNPPVETGGGPPSTGGENQGGTSAVAGGENQGGAGAVAGRQTQGGTGAVAGKQNQGGTAAAAGEAQAGSGNQTANPYPCRNPTPGDDPSGNTQVCDGGLRHRASAGQCVSKLPRATKVAPAPLPPDPELPVPSCSSDAECTEKPNGFCEFGEVGAYCGYGCIQDADCADGMLCDCGPFIGQCRPATCKTDADCADGLLCTAYDTSAGCEMIAFACQSKADQCGGPGDCPEEKAYCGPASNGARMCSGLSCAIGRPFLVEGHARLAPAARRAGWCEPVTVPDVALRDRARIAEAWTRIARMEHASIAAFARFVLELLSLSAPAELVSRATRAQGDEIRHAEGAFAIASAYAGRVIGPGPLDVTGSVGAVNLERTVIQALLEGCIGETLAALEAEAVLEHVTCPRARALLERVAVEEAEHAELAFRFLRWALEVDPSLVSRCEVAFRGVVREAEWAARSPAPAGASDDVLLAAGVLPDSLRQRVRSEGLREVISPCLEGLFAARIAA